MLNRFAFSLTIALGLIALATPIALSKNCPKKQAGGGSYNSTSYQGNGGLKAILVNLEQIPSDKQAAFQSQSASIRSDKPCRAPQGAWCVVLEASAAQRVFERLHQEFGAAVQLKEAVRGGR